MPGDDHPGAMTPETLTQMVCRIERVENMLGSAQIKVLDVEKGLVDNRRAMLKEIDYD